MAFPTRLLASAAAAVFPVAAFAQDWSGPYVGLTFGTGSGDVTNPLTSTFDIGGDVYGLFAGYNQQSGAFVYGGELAYQSASVDLDILPGQGFDELVDLKGRIGYVTGQALIYGVLGYSWNRYSITEGTSSGNGPAFGLGIDYRISDRFILGADYLDRNMDNGLSGGVNPVEGDVSSLSLRLGLSF